MQSKLTIEIDTALLEQVQQQANKEGKTLSEMIEAYIRLALSHEEGSQRPFPKIHPIFELEEEDITDTDAEI